MDKKKDALQLKKGNNLSALRVKHSTKLIADRLLETANKKEFGRKISTDELIKLALEKVTKEDLKLLQNGSLKNRDRQTIVHQFYCKKVKKISEDEFIGFTMSSNYQPFLERNKTELSCLGV